VGVSSTVDNGDGTFTITYTDATTFISADLTGPQGPTGPSGSSSNPSLRNFLIFNNIGTLTDWTVPIGTSFIQIFMTSSKGGKGGNCTSTSGSIYQYGGNGGDAGSLSFSLPVQEGQIISYRIGDDGVDGIDTIDPLQNPNNYGVDGAPGGPTEVYLDGVPVIFLNGGSGGRGARCYNQNYNGRGADGSTGNIGTTYQDWFNYGVFDITQENIIKLGNQKLIIRY
jgi:hypothetical protein